MKSVYAKIVCRLSGKGLKEALMLNVSAMSGHMENNLAYWNKQKYFQWKGLWNLALERWED